MLVYSITENEVESVTKSLKGNSSAGLDEIPELLIKQCIKYIKKPLVHNFNASFNLGIFANKMKIAKVKSSLSKRGQTRFMKLQTNIHFTNLHFPNLRKADVLYLNTVFYQKHRIDLGKCYQQKQLVKLSQNVFKRPWINIYAQ
jgi:hypothetical protein